MRTRKHTHRTTEPDKKYNSLTIAKLINRSMRDGKKTKAQKQVYKALDILGEKTKKKPDELLDSVIDKIKPQMEVRSRRVGGASYQVPMPVRPRRAFSLAIRWLVQAANKRPNKQYHTYAEKLVAEIMDALENRGGAIEKKNTSHKMAESNKAFSHFRW